MTGDFDGLFDVEVPVVEVDVGGSLCCCSLRHPGLAVTVVAAVRRNCLCCCRSCPLSWKKFRVGPLYLSCNRRPSVVQRLL